jgi:CRISPR-associated protein Cas5d
MAEGSQIGRESRVFRVRAQGAIACFTRPEMKVERVSYEVMTPSAARGLLEAVVWKPAIEWRVRRIEVLAPIRWMSVRRNEVKSRASLEKRMILVDDDRAQRNTVALRDVDYVLDASFVMTARAGEGDNLRKFEDMFERRIVRGQHHTAPYLGCREFPAAVTPAVDTPRPIDPGIDRPLGWMFYDYDWSGFDGEVDHKASQARTPLFFEARLTDGILEVPNRPDVRPAREGAR